MSTPDLDAADHRLCLRDTLILTPNVLREIMTELEQRGYSDDIDWAEACAPPANADDFACELIFVICNSGMKNTVAVGVYRRVIAAIESDSSVSAAFGHAGKVAAIERIWRDRRGLFGIFNSCKTDTAKLYFLGGLPWIGSITKFHAARNFGVDCVKPDIHLQRIADHHGETPLELCTRLARSLHLRVGTVDAILWRASAIGIIDTRSLAPHPRPAS